jgi:hypothetical protein
MATNNSFVVNVKTFLSVMLALGQNKLERLSLESHLGLV